MVNVGGGVWVMAEMPCPFAVLTDLADFLK